LTTTDEHPFHYFPKLEKLTVVILGGEEKVLKWLVASTKNDDGLVSDKTDEQHSLPRLARLSVILVDPVNRTKHPRTIYENAIEWTRTIYKSRATPLQQASVLDSHWRLVWEIVTKAEVTAE
jgi:hypothetical protein